MTPAESTNRYIKKAYDRIIISVPKGTKEKLKEACKKNNATVNATIREYVEKCICAGKLL